MATGAAWQRSLPNMFVGAGNDVIGPLRDEERAHLHSVVRYNRWSALSRCRRCWLGPHGCCKKLLGRRLECLEKVEPGSAVEHSPRHRDHPWLNKARALAYRCRAPSWYGLQPRPNRSTCAIMTLQDLDWIRRTIGREEIDLWYFVRDLVEQPRVRQLLSWDVIDTWETWRDQGKSLYRGARDLDVLFVQPHHSILEWKAMSEQRHIELALHLLGMGRISEWPLHSLDDTSMLIGNTISGVLYRIVVCANPAAVSLIAGSGTEPTYRDLAHGLGECIAHKLECTAEEFASLMQSSGLSFAPD